MLGNLSDYDVSMAPREEEFCDLDQWALYRTEKFLKSCAPLTSPMSSIWPIMCWLISARST